MDPEKPAPRKSRFTPKSQSQRKGISSSAATPKIEKVDDQDVDTRQRLQQGLNEPRHRQPPKVETPVVTFTNKAKQLPTTVVSGSPHDGGRKQSSGLDLMQLDDGVGHSSKSSSSTAGPSETSVCIPDSKDDDLSPKPKTYKDPWDYTAYYPTTLPLRRPLSGDPEILDKAEFGEAAGNAEYDEASINPASELGLSNPNANPDEADQGDRLMFFQLPPSLPQLKRVASDKGKEKEGNFQPSNPRGSTTFAKDGSSTRAGISQRTCSLDDLSEGHMGKMLVYKSGAVKLKLGETLYNVSPGVDCNFAEDAAVINTEKKECCVIGSIEKRAVVTPDIDNILDSVTDLS